MRKAWAGMLFVGVWALAPGCSDRAIELNPDRSVVRVDLAVGRGLEAREGRLVVAHYRGWLEEGERLIIDTYARGQAHSWVVGDDTVITGMDAGVRGMRVGGKRRLRVPAISAYGAKGLGEAVPGDATLIFEVELLDVRTGGVDAVELRGAEVVEGGSGR